VKVLIIALAGLIVGIINGIAGGAASLTFPILVAFGLNPVVATATNSLGVWAANPFALIAQRRKVRTQLHHFLPLIAASSVGTIIGSIALITFPVHIFEKVVPLLLLVATLTMFIPLNPSSHTMGNRTEWWSIFASGIYNGYFGPGQGIIVIATLIRSRDFAHVNIGKTLVVGISAFFSSAIYLFGGVVSWRYMAPLAIGCATGGWAAGYLVGKIDIRYFRALVIFVGLTSSAWLMSKYWFAIS